MLGSSLREAQTGDKTEVQIKPQAFMDKGFVFVSTNYRLLPTVDMATIVGDVADPAGGTDARRSGTIKC